MPHECREYQREQVEEPRQAPFGVGRVEARCAHHHVGVAAHLCTALAEAGVNLRVLDQGSSEANIIVGVDEKDMDIAVTAIYDAFEAWE